MKGYPTYKDSGVAWLGDVPEHWEVKRTKYILQETDKRSSTGSEQLLSVSQYTGVTPRKKKGSTELVDTRANSLVGYKAVEKNDLVVNIMLAWNGSLGVSQYSGIVSPAYCIYRFTKEIHPLFFHYLYKTDIYKSTFKTYSTGVVESRLRLYTDKLGRIESLLPPLAEQQQIARYLDWQTDKINKFIKAKKRLIALLKEQKRNIINQAVTKGINPDVQMKDSGVEWLGEVPAHWEVRKLRHICSFQNGISASGDFFTDGTPFISYGDVYKNRVLPKTVAGKAKADLSQQKNYSVKKGDIFFTRTSETIDEIGIVSVCQKPIKLAVFSGFLIRARPIKPIISHFFSEFAFQATGVREYFSKEMNLVTRASLGQTLLKNLPVTLPPIDEQVNIAKHIEKETALIDQTITRTEREIELIQEYRTRLVSDVVTGKIDVRSVAIPDFEPAETDPAARNNKEPEDELVSLEAAA